MSAGEIEAYLEGDKLRRAEQWQMVRKILRYILPIWADSKEIKGVTEEDLLPIPMIDGELKQKAEYTEEQLREIFRKMDSVKIKK